MEQSTAAASLSTHPFTCNTCQVAFRASELQRAHMRSDWHRYNLNRKMANLPPLSAEMFAEKVHLAQEKTTTQAAKASFQKFCEPCQRHYYSANAYENHIGSQKHKAKVAEAEDAASMISSMVSFPSAPTPSTDADSAADDADLANRLEAAKLASTRKVDEETAALNPFQKCLFCSEVSSTVYFNIAHMGRVHGMFIPEREYLSDLEGLLDYLSEKISKYHECLYCGRMKHTRDGILEHMKDKGHCMIAFDTEEEQLEIGQFYDFRATYSDDGDDTDTESGTGSGARTPINGGVKLGAKRAAKVDGGEEHEEGWETDSDSDASSVASDDIGVLEADEEPAKVSTKRHHSSTNRPHLAKDGFHSHAHNHNHAVFHTEYELHLPSGRSAGHRSLNKYYRQNLHSYPAPGETDQRAIENGEDDADRGRSRAVTRSTRNLGMIGVSDNKKKMVKELERRERREQGRAMAKVQWANNKQSNHQKHFRDELLGTAA